MNNASFRVHHFALQASATMPLLCAVSATTKNEVGTGGIDMR
ncbi:MULTISPECIES: monooxygenase [Brevibacterium]|uniref:Monooxygenase n=1 Tax=Brevibacterium paucivorans TaxID=170994 RepID=A0A2N6VPP1_9MICO|nr:monooxygenase [Brevibacterium sp. ACRRH]MCG7298527.1 monooxygenase [Brevibacterium sp. ACRRH]MDK7748887.1 monooxygenase [Brevibacterium sp. UMB10442]PMD05973.1 monooxygenase [Brevibacterium paucivorans]